MVAGMVAAGTAELMVITAATATEDGAAIIPHTVAGAMAVITGPIGATGTLMAAITVTATPGPSSES